MDTVKNPRAKLVEIDHMISIYLSITARLWFKQVKLITGKGYATIMAQRDLYNLKFIFFKRSFYNFTTTIMKQVQHNYSIWVCCCLGDTASLVKGVEGGRVHMQTCKEWLEATILGTITTLVVGFTPSNYQKIVSLIAYYGIYSKYIHYGIYFKMT